MHVCAISEEVCLNFEDSDWLSCTVHPIRAEHQSDIRREGVRLTLFGLVSLTKARTRHETGSYKTYLYDTGRGKLIM